MNHRDMEQELRHLENVFGRITAADTVPSLKYWRSRLDALRQAPAVPQQRDRIKRLEQLLLKLELPLHANAAREKP